MTDRDRQSILEEMIVGTYENMGFAVMDIKVFSSGTFKLEIIDNHGPKEVLVSVLLHMVPANADQR